MGHALPSEKMFPFSFNLNYYYSDLSIEVFNVSVSQKTQKIPAVKVRGFKKTLVS